MSQQEIPPWLREQLARLEQLQQNLQAVQMQKQQVEAELSETDRALDELEDHRGRPADLQVRGEPPGEGDEGGDH